MGGGGIFLKNFRAFKAPLKHRTAMSRLLYGIESNLCISEAETAWFAIKMLMLQCRAEAFPAVATPCIVFGGESLFWQLSALLIQNENGSAVLTFFKDYLRAVEDNSRG
jgi:hypothetical protein